MRRYRAKWRAAARAAAGLRPNAPSSPRNRQAPNGASNFPQADFGGVRGCTSASRARYGQVSSALWRPIGMTPPVSAVWGLCARTAAAPLVAADKGRGIASEYFPCFEYSSMLPLNYCRHPGCPVRGKPNETTRRYTPKPATILRQQAAMPCPSGCWFFLAEEGRPVQMESERPLLRFAMQLLGAGAVLTG